MAGPSLIDAIRCIPLFVGLPDEQVEEFARKALFQCFGRGQIIFSRGDPGDRAFVIMSGTVDLVIDSPNGRELILARLGPGEHFGEMTLLDDLDRSASARVSAPVEL